MQNYKLIIQKIINEIEFYTIKILYKIIYHYLSLFIVYSFSINKNFINGKNRISNN